MRSRPEIRHIIAFTFVTLTMFGCSSEGKKPRPPMAKVNGILTYKGKPVSDAAVTFIVDGMPRSSSGTTNSEGRFKLTTYDTNDGAFQGTNKVIVVKSTLEMTGKASTELKPEDLEKLMMAGKVQEASQIKSDVPAKYGDAKKTPLKVTVEAGTNEKTIELED